jgi:hypothetical protein
VSKDADARAGAPRALGLYKPRPARVLAGDGRNGPEGQPLRVDGKTVELVRETWLVEDRWWTERPLRRRYWELVSMSGRNLVVFHDLISGRWFSQAA